VPDLYTIPEFVSYLQVTEFDTYTAELLRGLVTSEIRLQAGPAAYDALSDVSAFKAIALAAAKRASWNTAGLRSTSRTVDDYAETDTFAAESLTDVELTDAEVARIHRIMGDSSAAFTVRPAYLAGFQGRWPF
jgi:hypothetical protein